MAKKSIYDVAFAAGKTGGEYEASLGEVGDVWSDIESSRAMTAQRGERRGRTLDTILAATELTGQVAGGFEARREFQSSLKQVGADIGEGAGVKMGKGGKKWEDVSGLGKLFQKPTYKFGEGVQMSKADITTAGEMLKYGGTPDYTRFKPESMAAEVGGIGRNTTDEADYQEWLGQGPGMKQRLKGQAEQVGQFGRDLKTTATNIGIDVKEGIGKIKKSLGGEVEYAMSEGSDVAREMGLSKKEVKADIALSKTAKGDIWSGGPDWEAINKKQLADIESAKKSYGKRKGQYDWLKERGIIKDTPEEQMKGLGSEAAGDTDVKVDIPGIDQYGILGEHASLIDREEEERRRRMSVHGQSIINQPRP